MPEPTTMTRLSSMEKRDVVSDVTMCIAAAFVVAALLCCA